MPARVLLHGVVLATALAGAVGRSVEVAPAAPGPLAVATTNLEVRPQADAKAMFAYLNGSRGDAGLRYVTDIFVHPEAVPLTHIEVPPDARRYGRLAGMRMPLALLIVYPTTRDNARPDHEFPYSETGDRTLPRMQRPGEKPVFADAAAKYPLIVVSGGYNTHALWHLTHLKELAAQGYIVVDPLHGDGRGGDFAGNLSLRGLALRAAIDHVLGDPDFGPVIDASRIGATGESAGAHTVLAALGGVDPSGRVPAAADPRVRAAVGVVPFMGGSFGVWPFRVDAWHFGADHAGLRGVRRPFLALYGGRDTNVPPESVEAGVRALAGPVLAVRLEDEAHLLSAAAQRDVRAWESLFFAAWLRDDPDARRRWEEAGAMPGGVSDRVTHRRAGAEQR